MNRDGNKPKKVEDGKSVERNTIVLDRYIRQLNRLERRTDDAKSSEEIDNIRIEFMSLKNDFDSFFKVSFASVDKSSIQQLMRRRAYLEEKLLSYYDRSRDIDSKSLLQQVNDLSYYDLLFSAQSKKERLDERILEQEQIINSKEEVMDVKKTEYDSLKHFCDDFLYELKKKSKAVLNYQQLIGEIEPIRKLDVVSSALSNISSVGLSAMGSVVGVSLISSLSPASMIMGGYILSNSVRGMTNAFHGEEVYSYVASADYLDEIRSHQDDLSYLAHSFYDAKGMLKDLIQNYEREFVDFHDTSIFIKNMNLLTDMEKEFDLYEKSLNIASVSFIQLENYNKEKVKRIED